MDQNNGGIIGKINTPTTTVASGVWSLDSQFESQSGSTWPLAFPQTTFTNSVRMDGDQSDDSLSRSISGVSTTKFSLSFWTKYAAIEGVGSEAPILFGSENNSSDYITFQLNASNQIDFQFQGTQNRRITNRVFRDPSAYYHFLVVIDTTESTASDRLKIYVNGSQETSFATSTTNVSQSANISPIDETLNYSIGRYNGQSSDFCYDGYFSEFIAVYGQALTPSSFGVFNTISNVWEPRAYTGTYGSNGFKLNFSDSSNLGDDTSGNGNDFTVNNLTSVDQSTDTPSNNFATLNSVAQWDTGGSNVYSEANLKCVLSSNFGKATSTIGVTQGKWYMEVKQTAENIPLGNGESVINVIGDPIYTTSNWNGYAQTFGLRNHNGYEYTGTTEATSQHSNWTAGDIIGVALDMDNLRVYFSKNGQWYDGSGNWDESSPNAYISLSSSYSTYFLCLTLSHDSATETFEVNFGSPSFSISSGNSDANGHGNFEYAVPSGYYALCTKNLAEFG